LRDVLLDWGECSFETLCSELDCHPDDTRGDTVRELLDELMESGEAYKDGRYYGLHETVGVTCGS
jgi:hypothetical protein